MKRCLFALFYAIGITGLVAWWNRKRVTILCYHDIIPDDLGGQRQHPKDVRRALFIKQLDYLQQKYRVISLRDFIRAKNEGLTLPHYSVILTFDDGHRSLLTIAAPILLERAMPASSFIVTEHMLCDDASHAADSSETADYGQCLSWGDALALESKYHITTESHTCSHPDLLNVSGEESLHELSDSRKEIDRRMQSRAQAFAYPYGRYSESLAAEVRAAGYACALTVESGPNGTGNDLFTLRRTVIGSEDYWPMFAARVSGLTTWLFQLRGYFAWAIPIRERMGTINISGEEAPADQS
jgi:peptidoglycan/xylan/chitin deacetylase (PgdA/CDA1 family)